MNENPKISIVTITFNAEQHVESTIQSVCSQDYDNIEYIVVDGASSDGTLDIVDRYKTHMDSFVSEPDKGISDAFNKGIRMATGDLVLLLSADDYLYGSDTISKVAANFVNNPNIDVIHGNVIMLDSEKSSEVISKPDPSLKSALFGQPLKHGAMFITKRAYDAFGLYDENYKYAMDYELVLRFIKKNARFRYINDNLAVIRCGGVNQRYRQNTLNECFSISIQFGAPVWKAQLYKSWKITKDIIRIMLDKLGLKYFIDLFRAVRNIVRGV
jgi:glycosyltransferase involved in cell wall biosynthesis